MSHTFHQLYYHFIWSTHSRDLLIDRIWRPQLLNLLNEEVKNKGGIPIRHNAMPDHIHLLVRLQPKIALSDFIGQVKGATSFRANREIEMKYKLQWQDGYGVLSLRQDELTNVSRYIDRQEDHHKANKLSGTLETIDVEEDDFHGELIR